MRPNHSIGSFHDEVKGAIALGGNLCTLMNDYVPLRDHQIKLYLV